jgi:ribosomal-protein-alanine N-acetyltransferase
VNIQLEMQMREMVREDIDAVTAIEQQIHSHPWTRGMFMDALAHGNMCRLYAAGNEIVGYAILLPTLDEVELLDISIASSFQRQGLGEKLLAELLVLARENDWTRMLLEVRRSNLSAQGLYRKAGFEAIGIRRDYYALTNGREDAIVMEKKLL